MGVNTDKQVFTGLLLTVLLLGQSISVAADSGRPEKLTLESFQFGPVNRWAFSHMREVIPTVNIPRDPTQFLVLKKQSTLVTDFSVKFQGRQQSIDNIAEQQYIDGLLILKDGDIVFEQYYGSLKPELPHLMNSVSKSVVALVAGKLAADRGHRPQ